MSNTVVLLVLLLGKVRLVFLDAIFSISIFFNKIIQKSDCCWALAQVCPAPMLSKSEILMSLNSKQKSLLELATTELYLNSKKWQKRVWVWCLRL